MARLLLWLIVLGVLGGVGWFTHATLTGRTPSLALLLADIGLPLSGGGDERRGDRGRATYVVTAAIVMADFSDRIEVTGTARANEAITVTAKATETVGRVNFTDGQAVTKGFVIAEMTNAQQSAQLAGARADLAEAEQQLTRAQELKKSGNASTALVDQRQAARDGAAARLRSAESQLEDRLMRAPFAGVLGLRQISPGTLVRPGDVVTTLDDISVIKADLGVAETVIAGMKPGLKVEARIAGYPERTFAGAISAIDTRADPVSRAVLVRAEFPNADGAIKPGMLMAVAIDVRPRQALAAPEDAIVPQGEDRFVYVIDAESKAELKKVTTGARRPGLVEILDGLKEGDDVVTEGTVKLRPGAPVTREAPKEKAPEGAPRKPREGGQGPRASMGPA